MLPEITNLINAIHNIAVNSTIVSDIEKATVTVEQVVTSIPSLTSTHAQAIASSVNTVLSVISTLLPAGTSPVVTAAVNAAESVSSAISRA